MKLHAFAIISVLLIAAGQAHAQSQCSPGSTLSTVYSDDLESGAAGWTHSGTGDTWALSAAQTSSGTNAWFAVDPATLSDQRLLSPAIVLPSNLTQLQLQFANRQSFETPNTDGRCWDAGVLEVSTDGGTSFTQVAGGTISGDPYDNVIWNDQPGNNPITVDYGATTAWCSDAGGAFTTAVVDLSAFAGTTAQFRWRLGSDSAAGNEGWYVDDIVVSGCQANLPADVNATKTASGSFSPGGDVTYTIVLTNNGSGTQSDNPGDEFTDIVPPQLAAVAASATSGTATTTGNTVTWNGSLASGASVTITITATIAPNASGVIANQGLVSYDSDGDGDNDASEVTDDPSTGTAGDATSITVLSADVPVPALGWFGMTLLGLLLGGFALRQRIS